MSAQLSYTRWKPIRYEKNGQEDISNFQGDVDLRMKSHPSGTKMEPKATHWQSSILGWAQAQQGKIKCVRKGKKYCKTKLGNHQFEE